MRGRKDYWISAIDALIESRGMCCYLPLCSSSVNHLFPEILFKREDRWHKHRELESKKYSRQRGKEEAREHMCYQALVGQAEIDLAFQTPSTVSSWSSRWRQTELKQRDLEEMFFRWSERFPTLATLERWQWDNQPHWALMYEVHERAKEALSNIRELERWMVPNKLNHMQVAL